VLTVIKQFFSAELEITQTDDSHTLQLAAAALLIELSRADFQRDTEEQQAVEKALQKTFSLNQNELQTLIDLAEQEAKDATSLYQFTRLINDNYSLEQKSRLIELMWQVALADGEICKYEDHLIRKVAELLYVPHQVFIRSKLAVLEGQ
jgi:uncharacterized tellurite resistance protein B-like protein